MEGCGAKNVFKVLFCTESIKEVSLSPSVKFKEPKEIAAVVLALDRELEISLNLPWAEETTSDKFSPDLETAFSAEKNTESILFADKIDSPPLTSYTRSSGKILSKTARAGDRRYF